MNEPLPLPIRVLVKGSSQTVWTSWMGGPRSDLAWPRVIEAELHAAGRPAIVRCEGYPSATARDALRTWDDEVIRWSPDVYIAQLGQFEAVHFFLPSWLEAHVHSHKTTPGPVRDRYRAALKVVWKSLARVQQAADARLDSTMFSNRPRRAVADLEVLIKRVRNIASPLVLLPDFLDPGPVYRKWFPGMHARTEVMNAAIDDLVAKLDNPDIRRFSIRAVAAGMELDGEPAPDGGHYTPEVHREVGRAMAQVIREWADDQPHLKLP